MRSGALRSRDGLGSASSISESAAGCGVGGLLLEGSSGEGRALPPAIAAAARHFPRLERQLAHFGPASEQIPSFGGLPLRFIGAQRLRSRRSPAHGPASHARDNRNFKSRAGKRRSHIPKIGRLAPVTLRHSAHFSRTPFANFICHKRASSGFFSKKNPPKPKKGSNLFFEVQIVSLT